MTGGKLTENKSNGLFNYKPRTVVESDEFETDELRLLKTQSLCNQYRERVSDAPCNLREDDEYVQELLQLATDIGCLLRSTDFNTEDELDEIKSAINGCRKLLDEGHLDAEQEMISEWKIGAPGHIDPYKLM